MSLIALLGAYATPLFATPFIAMLALLAFVGPKARPSILGIIALMALGLAFLSFFLASSARNALVRGVPVDGEVLTVRAGARSGLLGRVRVDGSGRRFEGDYAWGLTGRLRPGDRIQVLIDPDKDAVLLCIGLATG